MQESYYVITDTIFGVPSSCYSINLPQDWHVMVSESSSMLPDLGYSAQSARIRGYFRGLNKYLGFVLKCSLKGPIRDL